MIRIQEYGRGFASSREFAKFSSEDAEDRRSLMRGLVSDLGLDILQDLLEENTAALVNTRAFHAARENVQVLADLGFEVGFWESRIADAERKTA